MGGKGQHCNDVAGEDRSKGVDASRTWPDHRRCGGDGRCPADRRSHPDQRRHVAPDLDQPAEEERRPDEGDRERTDHHREALQTHAAYLAQRQSGAEHDDRGLQHRSGGEADARAKRDPGPITAAITAPSKIALTGPPSSGTNRPIPVATAAMATHTATPGGIVRVRRPNDDRLDLLTRRFSAVRRGRDRRGSDGDGWDHVRPGC